MKLGVLVNELSEVTAKWYLFGIQLGVETGRMNAFQSYSRYVTHKLNDMLQLWLQKDPRPTIQDLLEALRSDCVGYRRLANDLETKYEGKHRCMCQFPAFQFGIITLQSKTVTLNFAVHVFITQF